MGFWRETLRLTVDALKTVHRGGWRLGGVLLITQLIILVVSLPLVQWLFRTALRSAGMTGLDLGQLDLTGNIPLTLGLIVVIVVLALWIVSLQLTVLIAVLERARAGVALSATGLIGDMKRIALKLLHPSSLSLLGYLFVLVPLSGFGFASVVTQGISIPQFITGELQKTTGGIIGVTVFLLIITTLNLRFALTMPIFTLTRASGRQSLKTSRHITRGLTGLQVLVAVAVVSIVVSIVAALLTGVVLAPTALSDLWLPEASPGVAAFSLGIAQVAGAMLTGLATAWIAAILIEFVHARRREVTHEWVGRDAPATAKPDTPWGLGVLGVALGVAVLLGVANLTPMQNISRAPDTLVLAHRGFTVNAVENTLSSLRAAAEAGVDLVEMDVMQAKDGGFIAMHDADLGRLTGVQAAVKDLTMEELTALTVRDRDGNEDRIPTFAEYVTLAAELEMPLLIEVKLSGAETGDHVDMLVDELETLGLLERNIYHSLDAASVARLTHLRPDLSVGYTMAFAAETAPDTPADFIVVEQWTATDHMHTSAKRAGLGFWVWTVNDEADYRKYLRDGVDGIVSDRPDLIMQARDAMADETGLAATLFDALTRFITAF